MKTREGHTADWLVYVAIGLATSGDTEDSNPWIGDGSEDAKYFAIVLIEIPHRGSNASTVKPNRMTGSCYAAVVSFFQAIILACVFNAGYSRFRLAVRRNRSGFVKCVKVMSNLDTAQAALEGGAGSPGDFKDPSLTNMSLCTIVGARFDESLSRSNRHWEVQHLTNNLDCSYYYQSRLGVGISVPTGPAALSWANRLSTAVILVPRLVNAHQIDGNENRICSLALVPDLLGPGCCYVGVPGEAPERETGKLAVSGCDAGRVEALVVCGEDPQPGFGCGSGGELEDDVVGGQRLAPPVLGDEAERAALRFVSPRGYSGVVAGGAHEASLSRRSQLLLTQPVAVAVGRADIRHDQQLGRLAVAISIHGPPPEVDSVDCERPGVVIVAGAHPLLVGAHVMDPAAGGLRDLRVGEVVSAEAGLTILGLPLGSRDGFGSADQTILLSVTVHRWLTRFQSPSGQRVDVPEMAFTVRVLGSPGGLGSRLRALAHGLQKLPQRPPTDPTSISYSTKDSWWLGFNVQRSGDLGSPQATGTTSSSRSNSSVTSTSSTWGRSLPSARTRLVGISFTLNAIALAITALRLVPAASATTVGLPWLIERTTSPAKSRRYLSSRYWKINSTKPPKASEFISTSKTTTNYPKGIVTARCLSVPQSSLRLLVILGCRAHRSPPKRQM